MRVLLTAPYENTKALRELESLFDTIIYKPWKSYGRAFNSNEINILLADNKADGLIVEHDMISEEVLRTNPQLKFVGVCRGTPSNIDVEVATELGIPVFNTPARNAQAVAEMFLANVITLMRNTIPAINWLESQKWEKGAHTSYLEFKGNELAGKKVGMVGFGAVAQHIARMLVNFPAEIYYYDPYYIDPNENYIKVELEELFSTCDIVGIHLPVTSETLGMIDQKYLSLMHSNAIFVNTARASVVNKWDLLDIIESEKIRGAILDVYYNEPPDLIDYRMIMHKNVLATPHIAGATYEVEDHHAFIMNNSLREYFHNKNTSIKQLVNKEIIKII